MFLSSGFRIQSTQCDEMNKPKTKCGRATWYLTMVNDHGHSDNDSRGTSTNNIVTM
jgi:hypothetical protein